MGEGATTLLEEIFRIDVSGARRRTYGTEFSSTCRDLLPDHYTHVTLFGEEDGLLPATGVIGAVERGFLPDFRAVYVHCSAANESDAMWNRAVPSQTRPLPQVKSYTDR